MIPENTLYFFNKLPLKLESGPWGGAAAAALFYQSRGWGPKKIIRGRGWGRGKNKSAEAGSKIPENPKAPKS